MRLPYILFTYLSYHLGSILSQHHHKRQQGLWWVPRAAIRGTQQDNLPLLLLQQVQFSPFFIGNKSHLWISVASGRLPRGRCSSDRVGAFTGAHSASQRNKNLLNEPLGQHRTVGWKFSCKLRLFLQETVELYMWRMHNRTAERDGRMMARCLVSWILVTLLIARLLSSPPESSSNDRE